jgi:hypothetical protein
MKRWYSLSLLRTVHLEDIVGWDDFNVERHVGVLILWVLGVETVVK